MKVLHITSSVSKNLGGTSEVVPKICVVQKRIGLDVSLACCAVNVLSDAAVSATDVGVRLKLFKCTQSRLNRIVFSREMMFGLSNLVKQVDVVHLHGGWLFPVWWGAHCARRCGKPYVIMPHGSLEPARLTISKSKKTFSGRLFDKRVYRHASAVWVTAESEADGVRKYGVTVPIDIVPLGIDVEKYCVAKRDMKLLHRLGIDENRCIVLYLSRITQVKGLDMLSEAWSQVAVRHPRWQLVIAGPDDQHGYRLTAEKLFGKICPLGSYRFVGPVYGDDKLSLLKSASLFVLPTRNENFSIAVAEALASGVPVVCTKGAPWAAIDISSSSRCGWWVDIDSRAIAQALEEGMGMSIDERVRMGLRGVELVQRDFSWDAIAYRMLHSYKRILETTS